MGGPAPTPGHYLVPVLVATTLAYVVASIDVLIGCEIGAVVAISV